MPAQGVGLSAAAAAAGVGSFLFHGPQPKAARWLHDASMTWLLAELLVGGAVPSASKRLESKHVAAKGALLWAISKVRPESINALAGLVAATLTTKELHALRRGKRHLVQNTWGYAYTRALVGLIAGAAALVLGRSESPLCDPDRLVQLHGLWHVCAAIALDGYAHAVAER
jgi:hypothetical protein